MNKYLEKVAKIIPRNFGRMMQKGLSGMGRDAKNAGKLAESSKAVAERASSQANKSNFQAKVFKSMSKDIENDVRVGNSEAKAFRDNNFARKSQTRASRAAKAADLKNKAHANAKTTAKVAGGVTATGAAGAGLYGLNKESGLNLKALFKKKPSVTTGEPAHWAAIRAEEEATLQSARKAHNTELRSARADMMRENPERERTIAKGIPSHLKDIEYFKE